MSFLWNQTLCPICLKDRFSNTIHDGCDANIKQMFDYFAYTTVHTHYRA